MIAKRFRAGFLGVLGLALIAAQDAPALDYPQPPPLVAERIVDGRFELGNFEYLRGYFPEASDAEKADYAAIANWVEACGEQGQARLDAELTPLGVSYAGGSLLRAASVCQQIALGSQFEDFASFAELSHAARGARLVFDTLVQSILRAEERMRAAQSDGYASELHRRALADQMLRNAFHWGWAEVSAPRVPKMNAKERKVFLALLGSEVMRVDHQNTQWLKARVEEEGWPTISKVGKRAAFTAWLLAQHADMDPAFQLRALRLMEPLLAEDEVSKANYAYLYDRVMLKLVGKQRYGSQLQCVKGVRGPQPLEDPDRVDDLRADMGMGTVAEYLDGISVPCAP